MLFRNFLLLLILAVMVSACARSDLQGVDPEDYYSEHPVENKIETRHMLYTLDFRVDKNRLSGGEIEAFQSAMSDISPEAVSSIIVKLAPSQIYNMQRRDYVSKLLRSMGYDAKTIHFEPAKEIRIREAALDVAYAFVVNPHCPDWRMSPITTYGNMPASNFRCATTVNLGAMVADPRDLERGRGETGANTSSSVKALQDYRSGDLVTSTNSSVNSNPDSSSAAPAQ